MGWLINNPSESSSIDIFLLLNTSPEAKTFAQQAVEALQDGVFPSFDFILNNRTYLDANETGDIDNNTIGGEDMTAYPDFDPIQQSWPNISPVIPTTDFIGWGSSGIRKNCMDYAKAQIAKNGYQISNYFNSTGQTIQIYTDQNGVNTTELKKGLSYLKYALENGIPVVVGVGAETGKPSPNPDTDNTTDHFIVIVGMGSDSDGDYFVFYDNASGNPIQGASSNNKLYYDSSTGVVSGFSDTNYGIKYKPYIITMIRKSKKL